LVGGVQNSTAFIYQPNKNAQYYIDLAGGFTEFAENDNVYILKANGVVSKELSIISLGDSIYVPERVKENVDYWGMFLATIQVFSTVANTAILAKSLGLLK
jgi:protein involved in polysaccharide export with SLBB domain